MFGAKMLRDQACIGQFTKSRDIKTDCERFDGLFRQLAHCSRASTGVHTSAEQCSYRYVGYHTFLDSAMNMLPNTLNILGDGMRFSLSERVIPVTLLMKFAIFAQQPVSGQQLIDV